MDGQSLTHRGLSLSLRLCAHLPHFFINTITSNTQSIHT